MVTDEDGEVTIPLENGTYRAIEVEAPERYEKSPVEEIFKISGNEDEQDIGTPDEFDDTLEINYIEDLVDFAENVRNGNTYSRTKVVLKRTLDFSDSSSYRDATDTATYGDYNFDGNVESIKTELSTGVGFRGIGVSISTPFSGIFDGQGNEINGIHIDYKTNVPSDVNGFSFENAGLFRYVENGKIKNLGVGGSIKNKNGSTAGLISSGVNIETYNCYNNCDIEGTRQCGSILGYVTGYMTIENCHNNGNLIFSGSYNGRNCRNDQR